MKKLLLKGMLVAVAAFVPILSGLAPIESVLADTPGNGCMSISGGGNTCMTANDIAIDKKVLSPADNSFVDNLTMGDAKYSPSAPISFQITLTNKTDSEQKGIVITDTLPTVVDYAQSAGKFDSVANTVTFTIDTLGKKATKKVTIQGRIKKAGAFTQSVTCVANEIVAVKGNQTASDNTQFCIDSAKQNSQPPAQSNQTKGGAVEGTQTNNMQPGSTTKGGLVMNTQQGSKELPGTGPELLPLLAMIPAGLSGLYLRKKTSI